MPDKNTFSLGDDGELELVEDSLWQGEKAKRSASPWRRIGRSSLIPTLVLVQTACIGLLCAAIALFTVGGFDPMQMRCRILGMCPTPTSPTPGVTRSVSATSRVTVVTAAPVVDVPCMAHEFAGTAPKIAFISDRQSPFGAAYLTDPNGSFVCHLHTNGEGVDNVAWSSDGQRLAFTTSRGILVAKVDGTAPRFLVGPVAPDEPIRWSPDGLQLLYISELQSGGMGITSIRVDGAGQAALTSSSARDRGAAWSPDGLRIVFSSDQNGHRAIDVMAVDGSNRLSLTSDLATDDHPDWSPDGHQIVFASEQDGDREIFVMNADGSARRRLTASQGRDDFPRWSPDGKQIVFVSYRDGNNEIYLMDADGANQRRLTSDRADDTRPVWIPWQTAQ